MPIAFDDNYWIEIPGGRYTVGLLPEEARRLAEVSAKYADGKGVPYTPNETKNLMRAAVLLSQHANPAWVTDYLLAHYPARDIEIAPFAIARRPVTNREWRRFMAATGEIAPRRWSQVDDGNQGDELAAQGVEWAAALAYCAWAGARLAFEDEWEVAARGTERRLFPWGDALEPHGAFLEDDMDVYPMDPAMATPSGIFGMINSGCEWCAEPWTVPPGLDVAHWADGYPWDDARALHSSRVVRGESDARFAPSSVTRFAAPVAALHTRYPRVRLVRADGRQIPPLNPSPALAADLAVREFDIHTLRRLFKELPSTRVEAENTIVLEGSRDYVPHDAYNGFITTQRREHLGWDSGVNRKTPNEPHGGTVLALVSRDAARRTPQEHGIYLWTCQYRLDPVTNQVGARPVVAYRMKFNQRVHVFVHRFDPALEWTPLTQVTDDQIRKHIRDTYWFYSQHADDAASPF
jgi:formylglycine-generating enzyme required for sulfatase activity